MALGRIQGLSILREMVIIQGMDTLYAGKSLPAAFVAMPDFRASSGRRHPLPDILALAVCAMLSGSRTSTPCASGAALGFTHPKPTAVLRRRRVFRGPDVRAFEEAVDQWGRQCPAPDAGGRVAIAVDGKALQSAAGSGRTAKESSTPAGKWWRWPSPR